MNNKEFVTRIPGPSIIRFLFTDTRAAWLWLVVRLYVGWFWLNSGWEKLHSDWWTGEHAGAYVKGFINSAINKTEGEYPDVTQWYAWFLKTMVQPNTEIFSYAVAYGEVLVGIGLVAGAFTGVTAFFGGFMNLNFILAGTLRVNAVMAILQFLLVLAWRIAGWFGADRYFLPLFGMPWHPGKLFKKEKSEQQQTPQNE